MVSISKEDIVVEPIEFVIELFLRTIGKTITRDSVSGPVSEWGFWQWLWICFFSLTIVLFAWLVWRRYVRKIENNIS